MITSVKNELVKKYVKLMQSKKERDTLGLFVVEGEHLVQEAIRENLLVEVLISDKKYHAYEEYPHHYVSREVIEKICETVTPQGIIGLCHKPNSAKFNKYERLLLIDNIQDPGNMGTIIRTCDAFNYDGIIINTETVDVYNPKVVRSTQGALFRVNIIRKPLDEAINELKSLGVKVFGTSLNGKNLSSIKQEVQMAFILGNEAKGVNPKYINMTDGNILIEMSGKAESLNVAVAAGIIMYNFRK
mgnify:FL=1